MTTISLQISTLVALVVPAILIFTSLMSLAVSWGYNKGKEKTFLTKEEHTRICKCRTDDLYTELKEVRSKVDTMYGWMKRDNFEKGKK